MTRRDRILLIVGGGLIFALLFYFYFWVPKQSQIRDLQAQLAERRAQQERMETIARQVTQLRDEYQRLTTFIAQVETRLPAAKETPALLVQLERLSRSVGVGLMSIRPSRLEPASAAPAAGTGAQPARAAAPTYLRFPIAMTVQATYSQTVRLTTALRDFPRMIAIRSLTLQPRSLPGLTLTVDVETYVLPREAR
ncbi:MAG TPA: type 4a pilus biogenesis protein PilO [bacterium]|nr:type 4a pilus biogenesis protein PilO [bacterium]